MKKLIILTFFLILISACQQPDVEITIQEPVVEEGEAMIEKGLAAEAIPDGEEQVAEAPVLEDEEMETIQGETFDRSVLIEVLGVDKNDTGCLIRVGDEIAFIEEKESDVLNGIKIFVIESIRLHAEPATGICRIII